MTERLSSQRHQSILDLYEHCGNSQAELARTLNVSRTTAQSRLYEAQRWLTTNQGADPPPGTFEVARLPDHDISAQELIEHRKRQFAKRNEAEIARKLIGINIKMNGPIGIVHFGDPHVDDDGCDIARLEQDLDTTRETEGLYGANLGDLQNNWIGRLARLWAEQSTSASQAWKLVEWMVGSVDWLYIIAGNHDAWSGSGDPVKWMMKTQKGLYEAHGARVALKFPNSKIVRINARHDFSGHSMWNPNHGPMKAVQGGWRDHLLTCGHKHVSFVAGPLKDPSTGVLSWAVRCAGYKVHDRYAAENHLPDQNAFSACVSIIDPDYADDDARLMTVIPNVQEGAEYLTWKRAKWGQTKRTRGGKS